MTLQVTVGETNRTLAFGHECHHGRRRHGGQGLSHQLQRAPSFAEVGDFERTNAFSYAAWVKLPGGDDRTARFFRGCWIAMASDWDGIFGSTAAGRRCIRA